MVFSLLALVLGGVVVALDDDAAAQRGRRGDAVLTAVFAVMVTVPAVRFIGAVRETVVALLVAGGRRDGDRRLGAGRRPRTGSSTPCSGSRSSASFLTVYRLGAGLHGLGRRGVVTVVAGSLMLALTSAYAELLQRYGTHEPGRRRSTTRSGGATTTSAPSRARSSPCSASPP